MFFCAATRLKLESSKFNIFGSTENIASRAKFRLVENDPYLVRILIHFMYLFKLKFIKIKLCEMNFMELIELAVTFSKLFKMQIDPLILGGPETDSGL